MVIAFGDRPVVHTDPVVRAARGRLAAPAARAGGGARGLRTLSRGFCAPGSPFADTPPGRGARERQEPGPAISNCACTIDIGSAINLAVSCRKACPAPVGSPSPLSSGRRVRKSSNTRAKLGILCVTRWRKRVFDLYLECPTARVSLEFQRPKHRRPQPACRI